MEQELLQTFSSIGLNNKRDEYSLELMKIMAIINNELSKYEGITTEMVTDYDPDKDYVNDESKMLDIYYMDALKIENAIQTILMLQQNNNK